MFLSWIVFPLLLLALSAGCGLLVRRAAGIELPATLIAPVGFTVVVLTGEMTSLASWLADLAAPLAVALAVAGFLLSWGRPRGLDRYALYAALGVFVVYALPVVAFGEPTFTGYIKLDDTATWLALTDRIAEAGRDLSGLAPSSYEATLHFNLGSGYPIGAFTPLAIGSTLLGRDPAWVFQPYLATMALLLALCLYELAGEVVRRAPLRAVIAFLAAQPALLFGYYLWGGVKEIATALLLALLAALLPATVSATRLSWRGAIPAALAAASVVAVLTAAGAALWLLPMLFLAAFAVAVRFGGKVLLTRLAVVIGLAALVSLPWLLDAGILPRESGALSDPHELGNLVGPLSGWQAFGIWPTGDFRYHPSDSLATAVLIGVAIFGLVLGLRQIWIRRALGPGAFFAGLAVGALALVAIGSPWVGGKALATCAPAVLFVACLGAAFLWERGLKVEGGVILGLIALGVLWSNALGYREEFPAPYHQLAELERIGDRIAGQGPTLITADEPYAARHFLRKADVEGASELRRRQIPLNSGKTLESGETADIDQFSLPAVLEFPTLVLRRSPLASRPPLPYQLKGAGQYYEVWQKDDTAPPLDHLSLGEEGEPSAVPSCAEIERLANSGAPHLAASVRPDPTVIPMGSLALPSDWELGGGGAYATPHSSGTAEGTFEVTKASSYGVWIGGSLRGDVKVEIDGEEVGGSGIEFDHANEYRQLGTAKLRPGRHTIALNYTEASALAPAGGGEPFPIGPLAVSPGTAADAKVEIISAADAHSLCGRSLDWVEALPY